MTVQSSERPQGEVPHVVDKTRVLRRGDVIRSPTHPLRSALREAEQRFLLLQSRATEGASTQALSEYLAILAGLGGISERLQEASGRRDIPYLADRRLSAMHDHCRWLTRRVCAEFLLTLQVYLEVELKRIVEPHAFQLFLRLEEVGDGAREIETLTDRELMVRLREGTLLREILAQIRLGDVLGHGTLTPAEPFEERKLAE